MLPKELQTAINHMSPDNPRVADATVIFYEDYRVEECEVCKNHPGNEVAGQIKRRQVYDLPGSKFLVTDSIGVLLEFNGVAIHDSWKPYYHYACDHAVFTAHLLRDLTFTQERYKQTWATDFISFFLQMKTARERAIAQGKSSLSRLWGRLQKTITHNLLERFRDYHEDIRAFTGARYLTRTRSFVSTAQKQHFSILDALKDLFGDNQIHLQLVGAAE